jgi:quinone-modifying oxidoreductase, subunit QmoC
MTTQNVVSPDLDFVKDLMNSGGDTLKKCYQCATCSVACALSTDDSPFPRREMILAQWGQKEQLLADPNIWLCYNCNDCSTRCPRGAKPGNVMAALRQKVIEQFAFPGFMAKITNTPSLVWLVFFLPAVLVLIVIGIGGSFSPSTDHIHFADMISHLTLNLFFGGLFGAAMLGMFIGLDRMWRAYSGASLLAADKVKLGGALVEALKEMFFQKNLKECDENSDRYLAHIGLFYSFVVLFIVTSIAVLMILYDIFLGAPGAESYPINSLIHPLKIAGNAGGAVLVVAAGYLLYKRLAADPEEAPSSYFDWLFLVDILFVGITGLGAQFFRFGDMPGLAYPTYYLHLVFVFVLLIFLPYTKFAHMFYRTFAIAYTKYRVS